MAAFLQSPTIWDWLRHVDKHLPLQGVPNARHTDNRSHNMPELCFLPERTGGLGKQEQLFTHKWFHIYIHGCFISSVTVCTGIHKQGTREDNTFRCPRRPLALHSDRLSLYYLLYYKNMWLVPTEKIPIRHKIFRLYVIPSSTTYRKYCTSEEDHQKKRHSKIHHHGGVFVGPPVAT